MSAFRRAPRALGWAATTGFIYLLARTLAYSLTPASPAAARLLGQLGGPDPVLVALLSPMLGVILGSAILWLGSVGASERAALAGVRAPRIQVWPVLWRALGLFVCSTIVFAAIESYIHYRSGLGFHWLHCLLGPVHRGALPLLAALSLIAAATHAAACHFVAAVRAAAGRVLGARAQHRAALSSEAAVCPVEASPDPASHHLLEALGPRGPPLVVRRTYS